MALRRRLQPIAASSVVGAAAAVSAATSGTMLPLPSSSVDRSTQARQMTSKGQLNTASGAAGSSPAESGKQPSSGGGNTPSTSGGTNVKGPSPSTSPSSGYKPRMAATWKGLPRRYYEPTATTTSSTSSPSPSGGSGTGSGSPTQRAATSAPAGNGGASAVTKGSSSGGKFGTPLTPPSSTADSTATEKKGGGEAIVSPPSTATSGPTTTTTTTAASATAHSVADAVSAAATTVAAAVSGILSGGGGNGTATAATTASTAASGSVRGDEKTPPVEASIKPPTASSAAALDSHVAPDSPKGATTTTHPAAEVTTHPAAEVTTHPETASSSNTSTTSFHTTTKAATTATSPDDVTAPEAPTKQTAAQPLGAAPEVTPTMMAMEALAEQLKHEMKREKGEEEELVGAGKGGATAAASSSAASSSSSPSQHSSQQQQQSNATTASSSSDHPELTPAAAAALASTPTAATSAAAAIRKSSAKLVERIIDEKSLIEEERMAMMDKLYSGKRVRWGDDDINGSGGGAAGKDGGATTAGADTSSAAGSAAATVPHQTPHTFLPADVAAKLATEGANVKAVEKEILGNVANAAAAGAPTTAGRGAASPADATGSSGSGGGDHISSPPPDAPDTNQKDGHLHTVKASQTATATLQISPEEKAKKAKADAAAAAARAEVTERLGITVEEWMKRSAEAKAREEKRAEGEQGVVTDGGKVADAPTSADATTATPDSTTGKMVTCLQKKKGAAAADGTATPATPSGKDSFMGSGGSTTKKGPSADVGGATQTNAKEEEKIVELSKEALEEEERIALLIARNKRLHGALAKGMGTDLGQLLHKNLASAHRMLAAMAKRDKEIIALQQQQMQKSSSSATSLSTPPTSSSSSTAAAAVSAAEAIPPLLGHIDVPWAAYDATDEYFDRLHPVGGGTPTAVTTVTPTSWGGSAVDPAVKRHLQKMAMAAATAGGSMAAMPATHIPGDGTTQGGGPMLLNADGSPASSSSSISSGDGGDDIDRIIVNPTTGKITLPPRPVHVPAKLLVKQVWGSNKHNVNRVRHHLSQGGSGGVDSHWQGPCGGGGSHSNWRNSHSSSFASSFSAGHHHYGNHQGHYTPSSSSYTPSQQQPASFTTTASHNHVDWIDIQSHPTATLQEYLSAIASFLVDLDVHESLVQTTLDNVVLPQYSLADGCYALVLRSVVEDLSAGAARKRHASASSSGGSSPKETSTYTVSTSGSNGSSLEAATMTVEVDTIQELTNRITILAFPASGRVITVHRAPMPFIDTLHQEWSEEHGPAATVDYVTSLVAQEAVRTYHRAISQAIVLFDGYEARLFVPQKERSILAREIYHIKRRASVFSRSLQLIHESYANMCNGLGVPGYDVKFQDVQQELTHVRSLSEELSENATTVLSLLFQLSSYQLNGLMRVLTLFSAFFIPLTFIASVCGMDFDTLGLMKVGEEPGTHKAMYRYTLKDSEHGWNQPVVGGSMLLSAVVLMMSFRLRGLA